MKVRVAVPAFCFQKFKLVQMRQKKFPCYLLYLFYYKKMSKQEDLAPFIVNMFLKSDLSFPATLSFVPEVKSFDKALTSPDADSSKSQFQVL